MFMRWETSYTRLPWETVRGRYGLKHSFLFKYPCANTFKTCRGIALNHWQADYKTTKITPELKGKIARAKLRGAKPKVPLDVRNTTDASIKAVLNAMDWCYRNDPNLRPSAADIASGLRTALLALETEERVANDDKETVRIWSTVTGWHVWNFMR